jgi:hypothetical protein
MGFPSGEGSGSRSRPPFALDDGGGKEGGGDLRGVGGGGLSGACLWPLPSETYLGAVPSRAFALASPNRASNPQLGKKHRLMHIGKPLGGFFPPTMAALLETRFNERIALLWPLD